MVALTRKPKPDPEATYEPIQPFAMGTRVFNPGTRLRGDHEAVRASFGQWMLADLPDNEKSKLRGEALYGPMIAESAASERAKPPPPVAQPASGRFRAVRSWSLADPDLRDRGGIRAGEVVTADDERFRRYPHLFIQVVEERWR